MLARELQCNVTTHTCDGIDTRTNVFGFAAMFLATLRKHHSFDSDIGAELDRIVAAAAEPNANLRLRAADVHQRLRAIFERAGGESCVERVLPSAERVRIVGDRLAAKPIHPWDGQFFDDRSEDDNADNRHTAVK